MSTSPRPQSSWNGMGDAFTALSTIVAGMGVWGAIGYGLDRLLGTDPVFLVIGVLLGHFAAIYLIYVRTRNADPKSAKNTGGSRAS